MAKHPMMEVLTSIILTDGIPSGLGEVLELHWLENLSTLQKDKLFSWTHLHLF